MTQGFEQGGGAYSRYETYPEQRDDGSVWEVVYDKETDSFAERNVLPPEPQGPPRRSRDDVMGAQVGPPSPGAQAKLFAPLLQGPTQNNDWLGEGGYQPPPTGPQPQAAPQPTYGNGGGANGPMVYDYKSRAWSGTLPNSSPTPYVPPAGGNVDWAGGNVLPPGYTVPAVPGGTYANGMHTPRYGDYTPSVQPQGASPAPASPGGNPNAGEGLSNVRPFVDTQGPQPPAGSDAARKEFGDVGPWAGGYGPRYEQYSERRADGSTAIVVFDRATEKYKSADTAGNARPNLGEAGPQSGSAAGAGGAGGAAGSVNLKEYLSNPANAAWWAEFTRDHYDGRPENHSQLNYGGPDPIEYYMQYNNWRYRQDAPRDANGYPRQPTPEEALTMADADRRWGDALFRERGFAPTSSDWGKHYGAGSPKPFAGMANEYRGGGADLGAYKGGGGGGGAPATSPAGPWVDDGSGGVKWTGG